MALTTAQIQNAYVAFFNRPADVEGLNYWLAYTGNSAELLNTFAQSAEYKSLYSGMNNTQLVNAVYQNLFGHAPDIEGLNYWVNQLTQGKLAIGNIADAINKGAQGTDATIITNKVAAAGAFTTALDTTAEVLAYAGVSSTGLEAVKAWLAAVTSDAATVPNTDSVTKIITTVQNNVAASGSTITLTTGVDNLTGTAGNDTFLGSVGSPTTLSTADQLDGGAGTDTLKIYGGATVPLGLKNIEVLDYVNPGNTVSIDISALTGVTKLAVEDASGGVSLTTGKGVAVSLATAAGAAAGAGTVWTADNTETSVNLNLNGFQYKKGITPTGLTVNGTATTTVNISSTGNSNKIGTLDVGSAVTKLVASGDKSLSFTLAGTDVPNLDSLDSSAMTAGGVGVNLSNNTLKAGFTFAGGAGDDVLTFANDQLGAFTSGAQLDGGAGTDKVVISDTALTAAEYKALNDLKNFEVLGMNASATALTVDASKLTSIKTFSFDGDGAQNITNMSAGSTAWINASHTASNDINMASAAGASDLALKIGGATSTGLTINKLGIGQTAVALASNGDGTGTNTITTLGNADNSAYTITGSNDLTITNALAGTAIGSKVDASAFTGKLTVTGSALSDVLIGGAGNDVIDGGAITGAGTVTPAVTENAAVTFSALTNGQTVTLGSLTFTAGSAGATVAQVAAFFAGQAANGTGTTIAAAGSFSGTLAGWNTGTVSGGNKVTFTSTTPNSNILTDLANMGTGTATTGGADYTQGDGTTTEQATFTFSDLTAGQTVSLGSLVFAAGANGATAAQVANAFAGLSAGSTGGTVPTVGTGSGNLTNWTTGNVTGGNAVTFTSTTANTNVGDLTASGTGTATVASGGSYHQGTAGAAGTAASLDTLTGNGGSDTFKFSSADLDTKAGVVTAVITDFKSGVDKIQVTGGADAGAGSTTNFVKATAVAADLTTLLTAASGVLNGTVDYYVGQVGSDAYLVTDADGASSGGYTNVIKLTGVALDGIVAADLIA